LDLSGAKQKRLLQPGAQRKSYQAGGGFQSWFPSKASFVLEADWHQRLVMKITLKDKSSKEPITVHQAFVKLINAANKEVIFVAEPDTGKSYRFDLVINSLRTKSLALY